MIKPSLSNAERVALLDKMQADAESVLSAITGEWAQYTRESDGATCDIYAGDAWTIAGLMRSALLHIEECKKRQASINQAWLAHEQLKAEYAEKNWGEPPALPLFQEQDPDHE